MEATQKDRVSTKSDAVHRAAAALIATSRAGPHGAWPPIAGHPPVIAKGKGATVTDVDGNDYVDYAGAQQGLILGHADERVVVAINKTSTKGGVPGPVSETAVRLAELITSRFPSIDVVRFFHSLTETLLDAVRLARALTGRNHVVTLDGCVHQNLADLTVQRMGREGLTIAGSFNDESAVEAVFQKRGSTIAALIVEPVATGCGLVPPAEGFLPALRALCDRHEALLIYDETVTGFRLPDSAIPGMSEASPDLILLGAGLSGGLGLGGYGGRKAVMKHVGAAADSAHVLPEAGSLLAMAAGITTLQALGEPDVYDELETQGARLDEGLRAAAASADISIAHARVGSLLGIYFTDTPVKDSASAKACDFARFERFFHAMLDRGVLLPGSPLAPICVSAAHTNEQIDRTIEAARESLSFVGTGD